MTIEERLARLEAEAHKLRRQLRGLQGAVGGIACVAVSALLFGNAAGQADPPAAGLPGWAAESAEVAAPAVAEVIRAKRFEVVVGDEDPQVTAVLGADAASGGYLETWTPKGKRTVRLLGTPEGNGEFHLHNANDYELLSVMAGENGTGDVRVFNATGRTLVRMKTADNGDGYLAVSNNEGYDVAMLTSNDKHDGRIKAHDHVGKPLGVFGAGDDSEGMMRLHNAWGYPVFDFGTDLAKNGKLSVYGSEGQVLMSWPELPPVEDRGDLPPAPPHLLPRQGEQPAGAGSPPAAN